tara:strand:- start:179 stop:934 length:756 start_codon:yes stop_codon:yes gene_type:complete
MKQSLFFFSIISFLILPVFLQGEVIVFTKQDSADWTLQENQDRITNSVWITRKNNQGIFNIAQETGYSGNSGSPIGTLWASSSTAEAEIGDFTSFLNMHGGNPQSLINDTISLYLEEYGRYFDLVFLSFSGGNSGGGFSYTREEVFPNHLGFSNSINTPQTFRLHQNYPNPFNPLTIISYDLPNESLVTLLIYDLMGRKVRTLINSEQTVGFKNIQWNATDDNGQPVPAGMYIYTIQAGDFRQTKKMVLLK